VDTNDGYLTLKGLADYSGLSVRTLRGYIAHKARPLAHYRLIGKILVKRSEFDAWMQQYRREVPCQIDAIVDDVLKGL
jgi:hypothetical protein